MTNDLSTLSGALLEMKDELIYQLGQKGVTASYSSTDGLLGLIGRIADIQTGGGGSCYHIEFTEDSYQAVNNVATVTVYLQENYAPKTSATVTFTGGSSTVTATTDSNGIATATVTFSASGTLTATYSNVSDTATVTVQQYLLVCPGLESDCRPRADSQRQCLYTQFARGNHRQVAVPVFLPHRHDHQLGHQLRLLVRVHLHQGSQ